MLSLQRWDPLRDFLCVQRDLGRLFGTPLAHREGQGIHVPPLDVSETETEIVVTAELPGVDKEDIEIEVLPDSLSLKAVTSRESEDKDQTYHRRERVWRRVQRTIPLPAEVVPDQVKASLKEGLLAVRLPKSEQAKAEMPEKVRIE